jgi:hypothetical protein
LTQADMASKVEGAAGGVISDVAQQQQHKKKNKKPRISAGEAG